MKKTSLYLSLVSLSLGLAACTSPRQHVTLPPVGPAPAYAEGAPAPHGWLVVYSPLEPQFLTGEDQVMPRHSGYRIYTSDGERLKYVNNYVFDPDKISLPPGKYLVVGSAPGFDGVTTPVVIQDGKTTDVHLDGSAPAIGPGAPVTDVVRLPDGMIVGWRAE